MDLWLWDPPDDQDYLTSQHDNEDHLLCDFCLDNGRDVIEEDALNERYCLQVLNILVSKADEEITKLKEDILMLNCQLVWYNETLIEKTDQLNILIQNLKNGNTEDVEQPQSFDGSPKPLLENSVKSKQRDRGITETSILPTGDFHKEKSEVITSNVTKNIEEKESCTTMLKTNKRKSQSMEIEVDSMKQGSKYPRKVRKKSKFPETGRRQSLVFKEGEEHAREIKVKLERQEIETLQTNPAKSMERQMGSSSLPTQNVNVPQTYRLVEMSSSKNGEKVPNGASTSTSLPGKVTESCLSSQTIGMKKRCRKFPIRLEMKDYETSSSNITTEESREGVGPCTNHVKKLTLVNLKAICKTLKLRCYSKLCKAELIKLLVKEAPHLL